jgi:hypothetical protein
MGPKKSEKLMSSMLKLNITQILTQALANFLNKSHSWKANLLKMIFFSAEMPVRGNQHHQFAEQPGKGHHPQVFAEQLQAAQAANSPTRRGARISRHQWYRKIDSPKDPRRQAEAQSGTLQGPSRLAGDPEPLPWLRVAKLLHQNPGG